MWWVATAWADDVTLAEAVALGSPDQHTPLRDCDCVLLGWVQPTGVASFRVPKGDLQEVRHELTSEGQHDLSLLLRDGTVFSLEQAPCAVASFMVDNYRAVFDVPVTGTGEGVACPDVAAALDAYLHPKVVPFQSPTYGSIAGLSVRSSTGDAQPDLQDGWASERPWLGRCFAGVPGHASVSVRVERDGAVSHLRVESGPTEAVSACIGERVSAFAALPGKKRRVLIDVTLDPPAGDPVSP